MVLFAVASSVFQSVAKNNKQQKEQMQDVHTIKPKVQQTVKTMNKPNTSGSVASSKKSAAPVQKSKPQASNMQMESETFMEGSRSQALDNTGILPHGSEAATVEYPGLLQEITINDLQKSIIMAEVLGKPKALRKTAR
jgi:Ca2+-dependent lipid-binding protein